MNFIKNRTEKIISTGLIVVILLATSGHTNKINFNESKPIAMNQDTEKQFIQLPPPRLDSDFSIEEVMQKRRSQRNFVKSAISLEDLSQVLWAAYGITKPDNSRAIFRGGYRTAPSAGATFPLEVYAIAGKVKGLDPGVYKYISEGHQLTKVIDKDIRSDLAKAALNQEMIEDAPVSLFFSAVFERTAQRYGDRARERYVCMEMGHVGQNVYLQSEALGLGTCAIGAFNDNKVAEVMQLTDEEEALYIMPVGRYYRN